MHMSSGVRMRWFVVHYVIPTIKDDTFKKVKVLDVGSYDVNGTYRTLFDDRYFDYTGIDMEEGPNVDIVVKPYDWSNIETDSYDIVICGQVLEHAEFFWVTMSEMTRVLKKGGLMCIIVPNQIVEHRFPVDCYRFYTDSMVALARYNCLDILHASTYCHPVDDEDGTIDQWCYMTKENFNTTMGLMDTMLVAGKPYEGKTKLVDLSKYECVPIDHDILRGKLIPAEVV